MFSEEDLGVLLLAQEPHAMEDAALLEVLCGFASAAQLCLDDEEANTEVQAQCVDVLLQIAVAAQASLALNAQSPMLTALVQPLHDLLIPLDDDIPGATKFKYATADLCEQLWLGGYEGAEHLTAQLMPYLLLQSLREGASVSDVKRIYRVRLALELLDFTDDAISSTLELLLRTVISPLYLKSVDGEKFLAWLFMLDGGSLVESIVEVIRPQMVSSVRYSAAAKYGSIFLRSWKESSEDTRPVVERELQRLAHAGMHSSNVRYFENTRALLGILHSGKPTRGVDAMLVRIYDPILWRALQCANAEVRAQTCCIFCDAFPLLCIDDSIERMDERMHMQLALMETMLLDKDQRVRTLAVRGVCAALRDFWEAFPSTSIKALLMLVFTKLARDSSCVNVRVAAMDGIAEILTNKTSHRAIGPLLKSLSFTINDKADRVREAFVKMLQRVSEIDNVHFFDIVTIQDLFVHFTTADSKSSSVLAIAQLLKSSFYPQSTDGTSSSEEQLQRSLDLMEANLDAAVVFYSQLHRIASVGSATKMTVILFSYLTSKIQAKGEEVNILPLLKVLHAMVSSMQDKLCLSNHSTSAQLLLKYVSCAQAINMLALASDCSCSESNVLALKFLTVCEVVATASGQTILETNSFENYLLRFDHLPAADSAAEVSSLYYDAYFELIAVKGGLQKVLDRVMNCLRFDSKDGLSDLQIASPNPNDKKKGKRKIKASTSSIDVSTALCLLNHFAKFNSPSVVELKGNLCLVVTQLLRERWQSRIEGVKGASASNKDTSLQLFEIAAILSIQTVNAEDIETTEGLSDLLVWVYDSVIPCLCDASSISDRVNFISIDGPQSPAGVPPRRRVKPGSAVKQSMTSTESPADELISTISSILILTLQTVSDFHIVFEGLSTVSSRLIAIIEALQSDLMNKGSFRHTCLFPHVLKTSIILHYRENIAWKCLFEYSCMALDTSCHGTIIVALRALFPRASVTDRESVVNQITRTLLIKVAEGDFLAAEEIRSILCDTVFRDVFLKSLKSLAHDAVISASCSCIELLESVFEERDGGTHDLSLQLSSMAIVQANA